MGSCLNFPRLKKKLYGQFLEVRKTQNCCAVVGNSHDTRKKSKGSYLNFARLKSDGQLFELYMRKWVEQLFDLNRGHEKSPGQFIHFPKTQEIFVSKFMKYYVVK